MTLTTKHRRFPSYLFAGLCLLAFELFFFRGVLTPDLLVGNTGDARLNMLLAEHWYQFFQGKEPVLDLISFYPVQNTLSYSDMLLGFALPYSLLRLMGVSMFLANKYALLSFHVLGTASLFYLLHRKFRFHIGVSLIGTVVCSFANSYAIKSTHTQMFTFSLMPLFVIFVYGFLDNVSASPYKRRLFGCLAILQFLLILYTGFYTAYFTVLFGLIFGLVLLVVYTLRKGRPLSTLATFIRNHPLECMFYLSLTVLLAIPFLMAYLPTNRHFGSRPWTEVQFYLPRWVDLVHVSEYNLFYGRIFAAVDINSLEQCTGFPFLTALLFVISSLTVFSRVWKRNRCVVSDSHLRLSPGARPSQRPVENMDLIIFAMMIAVWLSVLLMVRVGSKSLWYYIYQYMPGASAVRAVARFTHYLTLPVAIVTAFSCQRLLEKTKGTEVVRSIGLAVLCIVLLMENAISPGYMTDWRASDAQRFLDRVPLPPADCRVLYVIEDPPDIKRTDYHNHQLDAWMIANHFQLKTINGYSGQLPDWNLWPVNHPDYRAHIAQWIERHGIEKVYAYNLVTHEWSPHRDDAASTG